MSCNGDCNQGRECNCRCKMTKDEALRMAIEAMEYHTEQTRPIEDTNKAIQACKEALAETQDGICCTEGCIKCDARKVLAEPQEPYNLVEILNDPMKAYPHNFSTPAKGNALLFGLCQEAADEIERLKAETQEPMIIKQDNGMVLKLGYDELPNGTAFYTTPPSREWQSLSYEEILRLEGLDCVDEEYIKRFARAIEAKLREKNT